jgi:hypothetical protein
MENTLTTQNHTVHETAGAAAASHAKAIVEARYTVAINRPRDIDQVRQALLKECARPRFAEKARYNKPIGKGIVGPSIRFAEAAVRCMTNIVIEESTIYDDEDKQIVQVTATDLESNVPYSTSVTVEKTVERSKVDDGDVVISQRKNSFGKTVYIRKATSEEVLDKKNALLSKAIRTIALRLVPGDIIDECMDAVIDTQRKSDAKDPDAAKRKLIDAFAALKIPVAQLKKYCGGDLDMLDAKDISELRAHYETIKEGETTWKAVMEAKFPESVVRSGDDIAPKSAE